ncbi:serine/threonine protein kinase [Candidatus Bathyarchaeota archaeon]|nr:MAG: serine/threonine protein kinase [Candidatus Bathyarchaeota archaeon]
MSSVDLAVSLFRRLEGGDFRVLQGLELGMTQYRFVPLEEVVRYSSLPPSEVGFRISNLHRLGLVYRWVGPYVGYALNTAGYDCLALNALVKGGILEALGKPLGVGKEADVYDALTPEGERVAVKFHRIGRTSFRDTRRKRGYEGDRRHISWLYRSRLAAEREFEALKLVHSVGVAVPRPIKQNRHVIVMGLIEGWELAEVGEIDEAEAVLNEVLENVRLSYQKAGVIHADLSEYNIIIQADGHVLLIDWPQYVTREHPNAEDLLRRDVRNVLNYFRRKFRVRRSLEEELARIKGEA